MKHNYKFYATLLDAFKWYQVSERENAEQELLDKINRVEVVDAESIYRMNRGKVLNDIIDEIILKNRYSGLEVFEAEMFSRGDYQYRTDVVKAIINEVKYSAVQTYHELTMTVKNSNVLLYGYSDFIHDNIVDDLKGTSSYDLGKYKSSMQRHLYPLSLSNDGIKIDMFRFIVTDYVNVFIEEYPFNAEQSKNELSECCSGLIEFIEAKRDLITDKKIFGGL